MRRLLVEAARFVVLTVACALSAGLPFAHPAVAAPSAAPLLAPVRALAVALNAQGAYPTAAFTPDCSVLDNFAPYAWNGAGAPRRWYAALVGATPAERRAIAAMHTHIEFGVPQYVRFERGRAYLVVPGTLTMTVARTLRTQHGRWTLVEVRDADGWRIASQAWAIVDGFAGA